MYLFVQNVLDYAINVKKKTLKQLNKRLLKSGGLWSQVIKKRAGYKCEIPNCTFKSNVLNAHHFVSRKAGRTKYMVENGVCLCASHHTLGLKSAHQSPYWFEDEMKKVRKKDWKCVHDIQWEIKKWKRWELEEIIEKFKKYLKDD